MVTKLTQRYLESLLDYFNSKKDAALAYNEAAILYHKEFAVLNEI